MTYIAEVTSTNRLAKKATAVLLGQKRPDGLWIAVPTEEIVIANIRDLNERQLVLVELYGDRTLLSVSHCSDRLIECLLSWSSRLTRFDSDKADLKLMRKSLEYQSTELLRREEDLKRREEFQRIQEKSLEELKLLAEDKFNAVKAQHESLTQAWKHLYYKEEQLLKGSE